MSDRDGPGTLVRPVPTPKLPYNGRYWVGDVGRESSKISSAVDMPGSTRPNESPLTSKTSRLWISGIPTAST